MLCLISFCAAEELSFNGRSELYQWIEEGSENPDSIQVLQIEDMWSSRLSDFNPKQHFEDGDFALITTMFPNLECLRLKTTIHLTDQSLMHLVNLPKLTTIEIVGEHMFSAFSSDMFLVIAKVAPQLETFVLKGPFPQDKIQRGSLVEAIQLMPNLKLLSLHTTYHPCYFNHNIYDIALVVKLVKYTLPVFVNGSEAKLYFDTDDGDFEVLY